MATVRMMLFLIVIESICWTTAELFTSIDDMTDLLHMENAMIKRLSEYIEQQEYKVEKLKQRLAGYQEHYDQVSPNFDQFILNPINAFLMTKMLTIDLDALTNEIVDGTNNEIFHNLYDADGDELNLPTSIDLNGAATAITRIQDTYNLNVNDMANGQVSQQLIESPILTAADCYEIGLNAFKTSQYKLSIPWLLISLERYADKSLTESKAKPVDIYGYLAYAYDKLGNILDAINATDKMLAINPDDHKALANQKNLQHKLDMNEHRTENVKRKYTIDDLKNSKDAMESYDRTQDAIYKQLCRNEIEPNSKQMAPLRCRYFYGKSPFLRIAPMKLEENSFDPYIVTYHDVIYDAEIETIKKMSVPRLVRAGVESINGTGTEIGEYVDYRISKSAWFEDVEHKYINDVTLRVRDMTDLTMEFAEDLQVVNYGMGGHYEPHFDFALDNDLTYINMGIGNRIATVLFYMSDVAEGGATVFPFINLALWPQKGSAAFWYNLYGSGIGDLRTKHAGCPVLIGSKWVANKWLHAYGQEFVRPCKLYPDHPIE